MANSYFNWPGNVNRFVPLDTARAEDVNYALDELSSGLDQVGADIGASIKVAITSVDQTITAGPVARADKLIAFDEDGNVTVTADTVTSIAVNAAAAEADAATASAQAGIATTKAGEASASASSASTSAGTATTQAGIAATQAGIATTQAGIATTQAGIATTQAGIATTQAGIATTKASEAAATASDLNAVLISKVSKTGDTINGDLVIAEAVPTSDTPRTTFSFDKLAFSSGSPFGTSTYTFDFGNKPSAPIPKGLIDFLPKIKTNNGAELNGGITADTSAINIGGGQIVKDVSGNVGIGVANSGAYGGAKFATLDGMSMVFPGSKLHLYYIGATNRAWIGSEIGGEITLGNGLAAPTERMRIDSSGTTTFVSAAFGYGPGAGGTVTQPTSKATAVTLHKPSGKITMHNATMSPGESIEFSLNNLFVSVDTIVVVNCDSWPNYIANCQRTADGGCLLRVTNYSGSSLSEAVAINFAIIKVATT